MGRFDWTEDEIILVCALVEESGWRTIAEKDPRTIALSRLLQTPAYYPLAGRPVNFRNTAGVERKSGDLCSLLPGHKETNGGRLTRVVFDRFRRDPAGMHEQARAIRAVLERWQGPPINVDPGDTEAEEGGVVLVQHRRYERDPVRKREKMLDAENRGVPIACEVCGFDFYLVYGDRGLDYIECHHRTPLSVSGKVRTRLEDLALVCSNCHRMIHRRPRQWLTVEALRDLVNRQRASIGLNHLPGQRMHKRASH